MAARFERVSRYADSDIPMPTRQTKYSAGYDMAAAEDVVIPPHYFDINSVANPTKTLAEIATINKQMKIKPTLVSSGMKCYLDEGTYLKLVSRSSFPLKYLILLANSEGIIDGDYVDNTSNEGEIFFQFINLSPYPIEIKKGELIGQAIVTPFLLTEDDSCTGNTRVGGMGSTSK